MKLNTVRIFLFNFCLLSVLLCLLEHTHAQTLQYSRENAFIDYSENLQLVKVKNNFHLLSFAADEHPRLFIYNQRLELQTGTKIPFKFPGKSDTRVISLDNYYYLLIHPPNSQKYLMWKIDENGNAKDISGIWEKLLYAQFKTGRINFNFLTDENKLFMVFHTLHGMEAETNILQLDTMLTVVNTKKINFSAKLGGGTVQQEMLKGKELILLKTTQINTMLVLIKVNLEKGSVLNYTYQSSFQYMQSSFSFNAVDSSITVWSLLKQPGTADNLKRYVFVSRLNNSLEEAVPFTILKSQFVKNTNTSFLLLNGYNWISLKAARNYNTVSLADNRFRDYTADTTLSSIFSINRIMPQYFSSKYSSPDNKQPVRVSLVSKDLTVKSDTLFSNNKNSYTLNAERYASFTTENKSYILVDQRFFKKSNGLLMISGNDNNELVFTDVRVNDRNEYLLTLSRTIPGGVIIPYRHRREAGLIKVIIP